jgi:hypothetical protein
MYLPTLKNARLASRYQIGNYIALIFTDCESAGLIQYTHVLYLLATGESQPCFAVASEMNSMSLQQGAEGRFLGVFPGDGHLNMGLSPDWLDLDKFTAKALQVVADHFHITTPPIALPMSDPNLN